jgi:hypothetical protein
MSHGTPRVAVALGVFVLMFAAIGAAFWYQDWQYSLPTPKPAGLRQPSLGISIDTSRSRPKLLHFYNPDCPCSQFNSGHLRDLVRTYGDRVEFQVVLQTNREDAIARWKKLGIEIPAKLDGDGRFAKKYGVYSTPQAVIVSSDGELYFRGNYNLTRYCTDENTEFARIALDSMLAEKPLPKMQKAAMTAYGCPLPEKP